MLTDMTRTRSGTVTTCENALQGYSIPPNKKKVCSGLVCVAVSSAVVSSVLLTRH